MRKNSVPGVLFKKSKKTEDQPSLWDVSIERIFSLTKAAKQMVFVPVKIRWNMSFESKYFPPLFFVMAKFFKNFKNFVHFLDTTCSINVYFLSRSRSPCDSRAKPLIRASHCRHIRPSLLLSFCRIMPDRKNNTVNRVSSLLNSRIAINTKNWEKVYHVSVFWFVRVS